MRLSLCWSLVVVLSSFTALAQSTEAPEAPPPTPPVVEPAQTAPPAEVEPSAPPTVVEPPSAPPPAAHRWSLGAGLAGNFLGSFLGSVSAGAFSPSAPEPPMFFAFIERRLGASWALLFGVGGA